MANIYGVDIGTSNFKMCCKDKEDILNEKNIIAIANKKDLLAFGDEAYEIMRKHLKISRFHFRLNLVLSQTLKICRHFF